MSEHINNNWVLQMPASQSDLLREMNLGLVERLREQECLTSSHQKERDNLHRTIGNQKKTINKLKKKLGDLRKTQNQQQQKEIDSPRLEVAIVSKVIPELMKQINNSKSNSVPIGFVYTQLPGQLEPKALWPDSEWANITAQYAGLFLRAEGGQSLPFGKGIQVEQTQSLEILPNDCGENCQNMSWQTIGHKANKLYFFTGGDQGDEVGIRMKLGNEEIRPRNTAIRFWKKTK